MTLSAFSRAVHEEGTFSFENCLRLADAFGDDPVVVLRVAGKLDQADLFQRVRGEKVANLRAQNFLETWSKLNTERQNTLNFVATEMVMAEAARSLPQQNHTSTSSSAKKRQGGKALDIKGQLTA